MFGEVTKRYKNGVAVVVDGFNVEWVFLWSGNLNDEM
jgi:hypothetical protein